MSDSQKNITRRDFIRQATCATLAVTLGLSDCNIPAEAGCEQAVRPIITIAIRTDITFFILLPLVLQLVVFSTLYILITTNEVRNFLSYTTL